jgi:acyl carrier protein
MPAITAEEVRNFLVSRYAASIQAKTGGIANPADSFDFLIEGVIDSFGVLEMVGEVERKFGLELDMSDLDAELITVLGPFSRYVADQSKSRSAGG